VARLVSLHAEAKRYLVATDPTYRSRLSARSLETLVEQGGVMTPAEVEAFARLDDLDSVLALRRADDDAKVPGLVVAGLDDWRPVLARVSHGPR
jgi:predicted HD phosphohydrolase